MADKKAAAQPHLCYRSPSATEKDQVSKVENTLLTRSLLNEIHAPVEISVLLY